jgi:hypothetical protein
MSSETVRQEIKEGSLESAAQIRSLWAQDFDAMAGSSPPKAPGETVIIIL